MKLIFDEQAVCVGLVIKMPFWKLIVLKAHDMLVSRTERVVNTAFAKGLSNIRPLGGVLQYLKLSYGP